MSNEFEYVNFPTDSFNVTDISDFFLFQDFDSNFLLSQLMYSEFHLSEGSLSEGFL